MVTAGSQSDHLTDRISLHISAQSFSPHFFVQLSLLDGKNV